MCLRQIRSSRIVSNVNICIFFFTSFVTHRIRRGVVYFSIRGHAVFPFQMLRTCPHRKNVRIFYADRSSYTAAAANYAGQRGINTHIYQYTTNFSFFKEFCKISLKTCVNDKLHACSAGFFLYYNYTFGFLLSSVEFIKFILILQKTRPTLVRRV